MAPCPLGAGSMVGRTHAPHRDARTRCSGRTARLRRTLGRAPVRFPTCSPGPACRRLLFALALVLAGCGGEPRRVVRPDGPLHRRRPAPRRLPGARGPDPDDVPRCQAPDTARFRPQLLAAANLGLAGRPRASRSSRFAGGTWSFGAERAPALAVFTAPGLTADLVARLLRRQRPDAAGRTDDPRQSPRRRSPAGTPAGSTPRPASGSRASSSGRRPTPTSSTSSSPTTCPTTGSRRRSPRSGTALSAGARVAAMTDRSNEADWATRREPGRRAAEPRRCDGAAERKPRFATLGDMTVERALRARGRSTTPRSTRPATSACPGEPPFTRGIHPNGYRSRLWTMRMFAGFGAAEDTNARFRQLLDAGPDRPVGRLRHADPVRLRHRRPRGRRRVRDVRRRRVQPGRHGGPARRPAARPGRRPR